MEHKLGHPLYHEGDCVRFQFVGKDDKVTELTGKVYIVDPYGTFEQSVQPSYDVMVDDFCGGACLFKHITEECLRRVDDE